MRPALHGGRRACDRVLQVSRSKWTFTNWFGQSVFSGLSNTAFSLRGPRGLVDLVVDGEQLSGRQLGLIVPAINNDLQRALLHLLPSTC